MTDICYVLPYYAPGDDQHYAHVPRLLRELAKHVNLFVIVQRGQGPEVPAARMILVQRKTGLIGRYTELRRLSRRVYQAGCRRFFVRISLKAAVALLIPPLAPDVEVYYWFSGQGRGLWPPWNRLAERSRVQIGDFLHRVVFSRATRVVTGPESMLEYLHQEYSVPRRRLRLLYNDVDSERFRPLDVSMRRKKRSEMGLDPGGLYALFVSRLSHHKGGDYLPHLANAFAESAPGLRLIAIGEAHVPLPAEVPPGLVYLGSKPNELLPDYYGVAEMLVLPSREAGFPRVLLEAMAAGLPVVAFDVGGVRDIVPPTQLRFVVPPGDLGSFVERVLRLVRDPSLRAQLGRLNRRKAEQYSPERVATMFVDRIGRGI
jgi:glycosyltransferase involved in cell wall biosynthesis